MDETYDVIVVGGGAAGLSGALNLARARRRVLVADAGEQRNLPAEGVHGCWRATGCRRASSCGSDGRRSSATAAPCSASA